MVALAAIVVAPLIFSAVGLSSSLLSVAIALLRWPLLLVLAAVALAAIYRYGPSRTEARWQWLSVGSAAAAIGWMLSSVLFSWYIANFGAYNATYGSLGAAVGMMMWMWISPSSSCSAASLTPRSSIRPRGIQRPATKSRLASGAR